MPEGVAAVSGAPAPGGAATGERPHEGAGAAAGGDAGTEVSEEELCRRHPGMSDAVWGLQVRQAGGCAGS